MSKVKKKKNFVLDTNVILHDHSCLGNFEEHDIYIPITVLEELDKFKKGSEQINYNAREFLRGLEHLVEDDILNEKGIKLGESLGNLFIEIGGGSRDTNELADVFMTNIPDHRILASVMSVSKKHPTMDTILVTKDVNLRLKARAVGLLAEDYINDKVSSSFLFEKSHKIIDNIGEEVIDELYLSQEGIPYSEFNFETALEPNECFIIQNGNKSVLVRYNPFTKRIHRLDKKTCFGIQPRNAEQVFAMELMTDPLIDLVAVTGKAGTGKTLLALAAALSQSDNYNQILLARPIISLGNKEIGFLPGDIQEKVAPYMQPLFDNLGVIKLALAYGGADFKKLDEIQREHRLVIEALAYIRGRSLSQTFCIIDEAQNLTPHEVKTIITRAGEGTKMVFTGDIQQIDSPYLDAQSNGLAYVIDKMKNEDLFAHVNLEKGERSRLSEIASQLL